MTASMAYYATRVWEKAVEDPSVDEGSRSSVEAYARYMASTLCLDEDDLVDEVLTIYEDRRVGKAAHRGRGNVPHREDRRPDHL